MRDLIEAAERAVAGATTGTWLAAPYSSVIGQPIVAAPGGRSIANVTHHDEGAANATSITTLYNLAKHPDFFPALKLFAALKAGDPALVERLAEVSANIRLFDGTSTDTARAIMRELTK